MEDGLPDPKRIAKSLKGMSLDAVTKALKADDVDEGTAKNILGAMGFDRKRLITAYLSSAAQI